MMIVESDLLERLEAIGQSVASTGRGLAVIGLGSVGAELDRLDAYSDLDFFVIVRPGAKRDFLDSLFWLEDAAPVAYAFMNTPDGYKLLFEDGIFAEMAVFEPDELAPIPFTGGRFIWKDPGFRLPVPLEGNKLPSAEPLHTTEWLVNEALTNLYIGLGRFLRGEKLSAARFIQGHALDRLLELAPLIEEPETVQADPFDPARRFERSFPQTAVHLPQLMPGYEDSPAAARAILAFLDTHFAVNPPIKKAILERC
jgi:lincosamide nucleotidyltransferase